MSKSAAALIKRKINIALAANPVGQLFARIGIACRKTLCRAVERMGPASNTVENHTEGGHRLGGPK